MSRLQPLHESYEYRFTGSTTLSKRRFRMFAPAMVRPTNLHFRIMSPFGRIWEQEFTDLDAKLGQMNDLAKLSSSKQTKITIAGNAG